MCSAISQTLFVATTAAEALRLCLLSRLPPEPLNCYRKPSRNSRSGLPLRIRIATICFVCVGLTGSLPALRKQPSLEMERMLALLHGV